VTLNQLKRKAQKFGATVEILNGEEYCVVVDAPWGKAWDVDPCRDDTSMLLCEMEDGESKADVHKDIADRMVRLKPYSEK
jgi:hypothetical protein